MKQKTLAAALLASMVLTMTACGSDAAETEAVESSAETVETDTEAEESNALEEEFEVQKAEAEEVDAAEAEAEEEETAEADKDEYTKGTLQGNVFESEWIGIRFEAPEGYVLSTEEEIEETLLAGGEIMFEEGAEEILDYTKLTTVYEMIARESTVGDPNVSVTVVKTDYSSADFIEGALSQVEGVDGISVTLVNEEPEIVEIAGKEFEKFEAEMDYSGYIMMQDYFFARQDDRMVYMVLTYTDKEAGEELMSGFSAY